MSREELDRLFTEYESAYNKLDPTIISGFYSDAFLYAGPRGIVAKNKAEFERKEGQSIELYRSAGLTSARIVSKRVMPISIEYSMVIVRWGLKFKNTGEKLTHFDVSYIVYEVASPPQIILIISHGDEQAKLKKLDLL